MKIVHALGWYFPESLGGTEVYVAALSKRLLALRHDVLVTAPDSSLDEEETYELDGISVFRYPIPASPNRAEVQSRTVTRGAERLHRWLEQVKPDVFHCHSIVTGLGLSELKVARTLGATVIATCHTPSLGFICQRGTMMRYGRELCDGIARPAKCASCSLEARGLSTSLARIAGSLPPSWSNLARRLPGRAGTAMGMPELIRFNAQLQHELLETVDALVVLTEWARRAVLGNHGSDRKIVLNRLGIVPQNIGVAADRVSQSPPRFGYMGRFHVTKGLLVLAGALSLIRADLDFSLELRGPAKSAEDKAMIERLQALLGQDPRVRFAPSVEHEHVGRALAEYDVLLVPSVSVEGGPTVAMEAQAVGTPVVGSRIGGLTEVVEDGVNGRLVPPGDAAALAAVIEEIVRGPNVIDRWRERLPTLRTMDDVTRDYLALYERGSRA